MIPKRMPNGEAAKQQQPQKIKKTGWESVPKRGHFIGLYGVGGAGKTTLATMLEGKTLIVDLEGSLSILKPKLEKLGLVENLTPCTVTDFSTLLALLYEEELTNFNNVVIDSFTRAQELAALDCIATIPGDSATIKNSIEQWTYGKGAQIVYDKFVSIYTPIVKLINAGVNVVAITHDNAVRTANPEGGDYLQHQPHLIQGDRGKAPGRDKYMQTVDHLLFLSADIKVDHGKASGGMSRTLYAGGLASMMAKSRTVQGLSFEVPSDEIFDWKQIVKE